MYASTHKFQHGDKQYSVCCWTDEMPRDNPIGIYPTGVEGTHVVQVRDESTLRLLLTEYFEPHCYNNAFDRYREIKNNPGKHVNFNTL